VCRSDIEARDSVTDEDDETETEGPSSDDSDDDDDDDAERDGGAIDELLDEALESDGLHEVSVTSDAKPAADHESAAQPVSY